jgi:hypothetical protein
MLLPLRVKQWWILDTFYYDGVAKKTKFIHSVTTIERYSKKSPFESRGLDGKQQLLHSHRVVEGLFAVLLTVVKTGE